MTPKDTHSQAGATAPTNLPYRPPPFEGKIGKTYKESEPAWPKIPTAGKDAPNIVVILLDDAGFGQTSTFGWLIPTPKLDQLASEALDHGPVTARGRQRSRRTTVGLVTRKESADKWLTIGSGWGGSGLGPVGQKP